VEKETDNCRIVFFLLGDSTASEFYVLMFRNILFHLHRLCTGPGAHPASYTMGTGSLPGLKRPGRGVDNPPSSSAEVKERIELYLYSSSGPSWSVVG